ncbi:hypothetical protein K8R14_05275 [bacterium]|nr:hypothetical protein [bacterium]
MKKTNRIKFAGLSDGIPDMPRRMSSREMLTDQVFLYLQIGSQILFLFAGVIGYIWHGVLGAIALALVGYVVGRLLRRSMGIRGTNSTEGFFVRMRERANGSRRGFLEWSLERLRRTHFTEVKCKAICDVYDDAMRKRRNSCDPSAQREILKNMDKRIKEISYD